MPVARKEKPVATKARKHEKKREMIRGNRTRGKKRYETKHKKKKNHQNSFSDFRRGKKKAQETLIYVRCR